MLWGVGGGVVTGVLLLAASYVIPGLFTPDVAVQENLRAALWSSWSPSRWPDTCSCWTGC